MEFIYISTNTHEILHETVRHFGKLHYQTFEKD